MGCAGRSYFLVAISHLSFVFPAIRTNTRVLLSKFAASRGFNIVPKTKLQSYLNGIDLRSAVEDNVAFKLSFGATFMLAAVAKFD